MLCSAVATRSLICTPCAVFAMAVSIFDAVSLAACALRWASARTSSATTAKPMPASPARAASTAAFSARMLVWKAISSIVLMIFATSSLDVLMSRMALFIASMSCVPVSAAARASFASAVARWAPSALRCVVLDISSSEELVSSREAACSLEPSASDWLEDATCREADAVCSEPALRVSATRRIGTVIERVIRTPSASASTTVTPQPISTRFEAPDSAAADSFVPVTVPSMLNFAVFSAAASTSSPVFRRRAPISSRASQLARKLSIPFR